MSRSTLDLFRKLGTRRRPGATAVSFDAPQAEQDQAMLEGIRCIVRLQVGSAAVVEITPRPADGDAPAAINITPTRDSAAPLSLYLLNETDFDVALGRHGSYREFHGFASEDALRAEIEECLWCVLSGNYQERVNF